MTQPTLPLPERTIRRSPFSLDERTRRIGRAGVARARQALADAARRAGTGDTDEHPASAA